MDKISTTFQNTSLTNSSQISEGTGSDGKRGIENDERKKLKARNRKEIESLEKLAVQDPQKKNERLCGCDAMCSIF